MRNCSQHCGYVASVISSEVGGMCVYRRFGVITHNVDGIFVLEAAAVLSSKFFHSSLNAYVMFYYHSS